MNQHVFDTYKLNKIKTMLTKTFLSPITYIYQVIYMKICKELYFERIPIIYHKLCKQLKLFPLKSLTLRNIKKQIQLNVKQDTSSYPLYFDIVLQKLLNLLKIDPSSSPKLFEMIKPHFISNLHSIITLRNKVINYGS